MEKQGIVTHDTPAATQEDELAKVAASQDTEKLADQRMASPQRSLSQEAEKCCGGRCKQQ